MIRKNIIFIFLILILCNFSVTKENEVVSTSTIEFLDIPLLRVEDAVARLRIPKIKLELPIYDKDSPNNTIAKNVEVLKESSNLESDAGMILLAAHSGVGEIAYFQELDQLERGDSVWLLFKAKQEEYEVVEKAIQNKSGSIQFSKRKQKMLILTTCMPHQKGKQLIVIAEKKESV